MNKTIHLIRRNYPVLIISALIILFFLEFFTKGYVLEGAGDRIESMVPLEIFALRSFQAGRIPQWNPHIYCGVTFIGTGYHNFFYPLKLLIYSFPERAFLTLLTVSAILHMFLAGFFFMLFAGTVIRDRFWALMSAVAYTFSFTLTYNLVYGSDCVIAFMYMPLFLYLIKTFQLRSIGRNLIFMTLSLALLILSGNIQLILYILALLMAYVIYTSCIFTNSRIRVNKKLVFIAFLSLIIALLITAIRTVPFLSFMRGFSGTFSSSFQELAAFDRTRSVALLRLFTPFFLSGKDAFFIGGLGAPVSFNVYVGLITAYMVLYAFFFIWNKETVFWKLLILTVVLIILGTPLAKLQYILTGRAYLMFSRYAWLLPVGFAMLFGMAGKAISENKKELKKCVIFSVITCTTIIIALYVVYHKTNMLWLKLQTVNPLFYSTKVDVFTSLNANMKNSFSYFLIGSLCVFLLFILIKKCGKDKNIIKLLLFSFLAIDLLSMSRANVTSLWPFLSPRPLKEFSVNEKHIEGLFKKSRKEFRVLGKTDNTRLDGLVRMGLYTPSGWGATIPYPLALVYSLENEDRIHMMGASPKGTRAVALTSTALRLLPNHKIEAIINHLPRTKLYWSYYVLPDIMNARKLLLDRSFDIHESITVNKRPTFIPNKNSGNGKAYIVEDSNEFIHIAVKTDTDALLLLTDNYAEGWEAFIDGKPVEILRANVAFKAVEVPRGRHDVVFRYNQPGLKTGILVSLIFIIPFILFSSAGLFLHYKEKRK